MIRVFVRRENRRPTQVNGEPDKSIASFEIDAPELERYLTDSDDGWQHQHVIGAEVIEAATH